MSVGFPSSSPGTRHITRDSAVRAARPSCGWDAGLGSRVPASADFASPSAGTGTFGRVQLVREKKAKHFFALKVMSIPEVIRLKQEQHVHNEKSVLKEVSHPFLVKL